MQNPLYNVGDAASLFNSVILEVKIIVGTTLCLEHVWKSLIFFAFCAKHSYSKDINTDHFGAKLSAWNF